MASDGSGDGAAMEADAPWAAEDAAAEESKSPPRRKKAMRHLGEEEDWPSSASEEDAYEVGVHAEPGADADTGSGAGRLEGTKQDAEAVSTSARAACAGRFMPAVR